MSFLPLLPSSGPSIIGKRVRVLVVRSGRHLDRRRLTFLFSRELTDALNWQPADRVVISLGLGADRGRVQISRVAKSKAGHKLSTVPNCRLLRCAVTTPVLLQGEDVAPVLDAFLDPASADFTVESGNLLVEMKPLRHAVEPAPEPVPLRSVA